MKKPWLQIALAFLALCGLAAALLAGCGGPGPKPKKHGVTRATAMEPVDLEDWPVLADDLDAASLAQATESSLAYLRRIPANRVFTFGPRRTTAAKLAQGLVRLKDVLTRYPDPLERTRALQENFILLRSVGSDGNGKVLMTGYYEPVLTARKNPAPPFVHPLYALPDDHLTIDLSQFSGDLPGKRLVGRVEGHRVVPYWDRSQIDFAGALKGKAQVLAYLADPVEAFFLHIQGSGQVRFADGSGLRLGYVASNGHPYRSIGRYLLKEGLMQPGEMSMQGIKAFLEKNPQLKKRILAHNPSYVFFRPLVAQGGPLGCFEQPLTGGRSIATDRRLFPGLAMAFISGTRPDAEKGEASFSRFVLNQDTGGAIRGPGRVDLFYGSGDAAGELAGRTKHDIRLYFLLPRP